MKQTQVLMGMPITVEVVGRGKTGAVKAVFDYFRAVDRRYSTYKPASEISQINQGLPETSWNEEVRWVLELCEATKRDTDGFFDIRQGQAIDPSGLVKGWAIQNTANLLLLEGCTDFYIEAGGDIQAHGRSASGELWRVGIRNPFEPSEIVKVIALNDAGIATSGTYIRGDHIYNPRSGYRSPKGIASLTIIAPTVYDADRFATAAYAMGRDGITFIESTAGLEGYMIDGTGTATMTSGFERFLP